MLTEDLLEEGLIGGDECGPPRGDVVDAGGLVDRDPRPPSPAAGLAMTRG
ncbi:hypothetical protein [Microbacterium sp. NIBRBAC000506063]|nr:hypothetical protein [Microbacterium sp. NIBRBAC000506063]